MSKMRPGSPEGTAYKPTFEGVGKKEKKVNEEMNSTQDFGEWARPTYVK